MLTQEEKKRWCENLRSGNYKQCKRHYVKDPEYPGDNFKYCAVGVLIYTDYEASLKLDMIKNDRGIDLKGKIIGLNDYDGKDFYEIANYIESEYEQEFIAKVD